MKGKTLDIPTIPLAEILSSGAPFMIRGLCEMGKPFFDRNANPHRHDFYAIYWIREGSMAHRIDSVRHVVSKNTLCFLAPGQIHQVEFSHRVEGLLIAFLDTFLCMRDREKAKGLNPDLFFNPEFYSIVTLSDAAAAELEWITQLMKKESEVRDDRQELAFQTLLRYFLILASREMGVAFSPNRLIRDQDSEVFRRFRIQIEQHYGDLKNVSDYARKLQIRPVVLNEISKRISGLTAGEHIRNRIILEAKRYLLVTDSSSKEIAYRLGFEDPHYFSRFFKKYTAQSPQEFRFLNRKESSLVP